MQVQVVDHPVVRHHMAQLRDKNTPPELFRSLIGRLTNLLVFRATETLQLKDCQIETPLTTFTGQRLNETIGLVPILRAGLGMIDPVLS